MSQSYDSYEIKVYMKTLQNFLLGSFIYNIYINIKRKE